MMNLFPHNLQAFDALYRTLITNEQRKSCIIHATGTGKSLIMAKMIETYPDKIHLFFAPSAMIFKEINKHISNPNIIFRTYQHYLQKDFSDLKNLSVNFIYLDEFHRIGAKEWGEIIKNIMEIYPNAKVIGASATHIRFLDDNRNMAKEIFDNNIASILTLNDSISNKIHIKPLYVSTFYNTDQLLANALRKVKRNSQPSDFTTISNSIKRNFEEFNIKNNAEKILDKYITEDRKKILVFFSNSNEFNLYKDIFKNVLYKKFKEEINVNSIHSKFGEKINQERLDTFSNESNPQVLFSVNMANEGLHIKGVDTVILFRKTTSPIIYFQQIGRCFSVGQKIQPLIIDFVDNVNKITLIDYFKIPKKSKTIKLQSTNTNVKHIYEKQSLSQDFDLNIDLQDHTLELTSFLEQFDNLSNLWEKNIILLKKHLEENNNNIPKATTPLGTWLRGVRTNIRTGQIIPEKKLLIMQMMPDFIENQYNLQWKNNYEILLKDYVIGKNINEYKKKTANFITKNKGFFNQNKILPERKELLLSLDPNFFKRKINESVARSDWNGQFLRLVKEHPNLSEITKIFVRKQQKNAHSLSNEKREKLSKYIELDGYKISPKIVEHKPIFDLIIEKGLPYMELEDEHYSYLKLVNLYDKKGKKYLSEQSREYLREHLDRFEQQEVLYGIRGRTLYFNMKTLTNFLIEENRYPKWDEYYQGLYIASFLKKWLYSTDIRRVLFSDTLDAFILLKEAKDKDSKN